MTRRVFTQLGFLFLLALCANANAESLMQKLLRVAGLTAAPTEMRGPDDGASISGDVWIVNADGSGRTALTSGGGYRSPIFPPSGNHVYALKGESLVRLSFSGGAPQTVSDAAGVVKLVGFDSSNPDALIVLFDRSSAPLGVLSMTSGKVAPLPYDAKAESDRVMLTQIRSEARTYGDIKLYVHAETKRGISRTIEWTDVYVSSGSQPATNVSACDGVNCTQPALSPNKKQVAFVKAGED